MAADFGIHQPHMPMTRKPGTDAPATVCVAVFERNALLREVLTQLIPALGPYTLSLVTDDADTFQAHLKSDPAIRIAVLGVVGDEDAGCALLLRVRKECPAVANLVLGFSPKRASTDRAVVGGAACVLCNTAGSKELGKALAKLSEPGGTCFDHSVQELYRPTQGDPAAKQQADRPALPPTAMRVLKLLLKPGGAVYKEVAALLGMEMSTFHTHRRALFKKFGVHHYQELVDKARVLGFHLY